MVWCGVASSTVVCCVALSCTVHDCCEVCRACARPCAWLCCGMLWLVVVWCGSWFGDMVCNAVLGSVVLC